MDRTALVKREKFVTLAPPGTEPVYASLTVPLLKYRVRYLLFFTAEVESDSLTSVLQQW
jgi:hypothetical protein